MQERGGDAARPNGENPHPLGHPLPLEGLGAGSSSGLGVSGPTPGTKMNWLRGRIGRVISIGV